MNPFIPRCQGEIGKIEIGYRDLVANYSLPYATKVANNLWPVTKTIRRPPSSGKNVLL